jgi:hypothetical protein
VASEQDPPVESGRPDDETGRPGKHRRDAEASRGPQPPEATPEPPAWTTQPPPWQPEPPLPPQPPEATPEPPAWTTQPPPRTTPWQPEAPPAGSMRFQDPATTRPRPPTVAEARARDKSIRKQREIEDARLAAEAKRQKRNRRLVGGAAVVGVVGVVAGLGYWALSPSHVTAQCVRDDPNGQPLIVPDDYCTSHTAGSGGFFFWGGHSYRYYYGSSGAIGSAPVGGTTVAPKGATITTKSGTTIQRGGLGSKFSSRGSGS